MPRPRRFLALVALTLVVSASLPVSAAPEEAPADDGPRWMPGPDSQAMLATLYQAAPFQAPAAALARASGGTVPRAHPRETLLFENSTRVEDAGRATVVTRSVWRILAASPDQTLTFEWSPWREEKPVIRARVVSPDAVESTLDPAAVVEGSAVVDGLALSDVHTLNVPLPNARQGSVIELEITRHETRAMVEGDGYLENWPLWSFDTVRLQRYAVEAPVGVPLNVETVGIDAPRVTTSDGVQRLQLEVPQQEFVPFGLTRAAFRESVPRFAWSTAPAWDVLARAYRQVLDEPFADAPDVSALAAEVAKARDLRDKVELAVRWVDERVRYTALHLGDGAIVPTRPSAVLARGFGDCKDLATLLVVVLRSLGIPADVALVMAEGPVPRARVPGLRAFNHMIVAVPRAGDTPLWVDATAHGFPAGVLPSGARDQQALIVSADSRGLVATPTHDQTPAILRETAEVTMAPFGSGSARLTLEYGGALEGATRARASRCDAHEAEALLQTSAQNLFGETPYKGRIEHCRLGEGPFLLLADLPTVPYVDTGDQQAVLGLKSRIIDVVGEEGLYGTEPGADKRLAEERAEASRKLVEQYGYTEDQVHGRPAFAFDANPVVERVFVVHLPPTFAVTSLPQSRTIPMGPGTWTETYAQPDDATVEVHFRFAAGKSDWSADEVLAFRDAFWKRVGEPMPQLVATFEPVKLLGEKRAFEAMALAQRLERANPRDGATRARVARVLLQLGLGDLARKEAARAAADAPDDALVQMVQGDVARHDVHGVAYQAPFERSLAVDSFRRALKREADHSWAAEALADTLRRNENGEIETRRTRDIDEATRVLQGLVDRNRASDSALETLIGIYSDTKQLEPLRKLLQQRPSLLENGNASTITMYTTFLGLDEALKRIDAFSDPKERVGALTVALGALAALRDYARLTELIDRFRPGPQLERELAAVRVMFAGVTAIDETDDTSDPLTAARSVLSIMANAPTPTERARRLAKIASSTAAHEFDGDPAEFSYVRIPKQDVAYFYDQLAAHGRCEADGDHGAVRVRCEVPENRAISINTWWSLERGRLRLESLGRIGHLAERAWTLAVANDLAQAGDWVRWSVDELDRARHQVMITKLLSDLWAQADHDDPAMVRAAAALVHMTYDDLIQDAPVEAVDELARARGTLTGALRRRVNLALAYIYDERGRYGEGADALRPVAESESETWMWRYLAELEGKAGRVDVATQLIDQALQRDPNDREWRKQRALLLLRTGKYDEAIEALERLRTEAGGAADVHNNLVWAHVMAGKVDEEVEREAFLLANNEQVSTNGLNTASMALLERGRVLEAAQYGIERHRRLGGKLDDAGWLMRGRLLQLLGYQAESIECFARVEGDNAGVIELRDRYRASPPGSPVSKAP